MCKVHEPGQALLKRIGRWIAGTAGSVDDLLGLRPEPASGIGARPWRWPRKD
jgi:hypothetical protein